MRPRSRGGPPPAQLLPGPRGLEDGDHEVTTESSAVPTRLP